MMQAMLMGQNFQLQRIWTEEYRNTGTFHVIVISGTHVAILAAFFLFLLRLCFVPQNLAMLLTSAAAWLYAMTSGWGAPCVRCAAGLTLYMVCRYFYRERRALNLLAAIALGFLVCDPDQLFESSFQLSFLAVAFLGAFAAPLIAATSGPLAAGSPISAIPAATSICAARGAVPHRNAAAGPRRCTFPPSASRCRCACCSSFTKSPSSPP
jgi:competence protein ComEC